MSGVSVAKKNGDQTSAIFANDTRWWPNSQILHRRDRSNSYVTETARPSGVLSCIPRATGCFDDTVLTTRAWHPSPPCQLLHWCIVEGVLLWVCCRNLPHQQLTWSGVLSISAAIHIVQLSFFYTMREARRWVICSQEGALPFIRLEGPEDRHLRNSSFGGHVTSLTLQCLWPRPPGVWLGGPGCKPGHSRRSWWSSPHLTASGLIPVMLYHK